MGFENVAVIPLHHKWKYLDVCCSLINEEWPRSTTARMHSLKASCDNLPTSLILVLFESDTNEELVIGHSKVSPIPRYPSACFLESVVVAEKFRGQGWGKYIMQETEIYVKGKGKTAIFLSTSDKEQFYTKLGYTKCDPISIYGCKNFQIKGGYQLSSLFSSKVLNIKVNDSWCRQSYPSSPATVAPPPPPPLPAKTINSTTKTYMMKTLP